MTPKRTDSAPTWPDWGFLLGVALAVCALVLARENLSEDGGRLVLLPLAVSSLVAGALLRLVAAVEQSGEVAAAAGRALVWEGAALGIALHLGWDIQRTVTVSAGLALMLIGNVTARARPSEWFGMRTRWALLSERAWYATQRRAAPVSVALGLALMLGGALLPAPALPWLLGLGLPLALLPLGVWLHLAARRDYLADPARRAAVPGARADLPPLAGPERALLALMWGLPLLSALGLLLALPGLPEQVPLHFGADGRPDRFGSPLELLLLPGIMLGAAALVRGMMRWTVATVPSRHATLAALAMMAALMAPLPLGGARGQIHLGLGLGHALALGVLALAFALPGPDGRRRGRAAAWCAGLGLLGLILLLALPPTAVKAVGLLFLALGTPLFLLPTLVWGVPLNTGWPKPPTSAQP